MDYFVLHHDQPNWPDAIAGRIFPNELSHLGHTSNAYRIAIELAPCPILVANLEGLTLACGNSAAAEFLQVTKSDLAEYVLPDFVPERELPIFWQSMSELQKGSRTTAQTLISAEDGIGVCRVELAVSKDQLIAIAQSVPTADAASAAPTDALTGLPDRRVLSTRIRETLAKGHPNWGILFIDLNDFKQVNDRFGHVAGDQVLLNIAGKLQASSRPHDLVVRYGGDEFVIFVDRVSSEQDLRTISNRIAREVVGLVDGAGPSVRVTCSVGCSMGAHHSSFEQIISAADRDMYRQKRNRESSN